MYNLLRVIDLHLVSRSQNTLIHSHETMTGDEQMAFAYTSYRNFKNTLGYLDSIMELNELAIRDFISRSTTYDSFGAYVNEKSKFHNVKVHSPELPTELSSIIARSYILSVSQALEFFLINFKNEHQQIRKISWKWVEGEPKLKTALRVSSNLYKFDKDISYQLCEYYRNIRNSTAHGNLVQNLKKIDSDYKKINSLKEQIQAKFGDLSAPNLFHFVSFDDFILYSRAAKDIAYKLSTLSRPSDQEFADSINLVKYKKFQNNLPRLKSAIITELVSNYGLSREDGQNIITLIDF